LQEEDLVISIYASTLIARTFRITAALAAHFDLEFKQYNIINAFINAKRDLDSVLVAC
jgi:hypothetical protein